MLFAWSLLATFRAYPSIPTISCHSSVILYLLCLLPSHLLPVAFLLDSFNFNLFPPFLFSLFCYLLLATFYADSPILNFFSTPILSYNCYISFLLTFSYQADDLICIPASCNSNLVIHPLRVTLTVALHVPTFIKLVTPSGYGYFSLFFYDYIIFGRGLCAET